MSADQQQAPAFATLVQGAVNAALTPERVAERVDQHITKLIDDTIASALSSWSGTGKSIKNAVEGALRVEGLNLPSYGHVVAQMLEAQIHDRVAEVVGKKLQEDMNALLRLAPARVKLSELVAELLGEDDDTIDEVGLRIEWSDYRSAWVYLNPGRAPTRKYDFKLRLLISLPKKAEEYDAGETPEGKISAGHVDGAELKRDIQFGFGAVGHDRREFGRWFGFAQKVLSMYAVGTVIELDEDACELSRHDW